MLIVLGIVLLIAYIISNSSQEEQGNKTPRGKMTEDTDTSFVVSTSKLSERKQEEENLKTEKHNETPRDKMTEELGIISLISYAISKLSQKIQEEQSLKEEEEHKAPRDKMIKDTDTPFVISTSKLSERKQEEQNLKTEEHNETPRDKVTEDTDTLFMISTVSLGMAILGRNIPLMRFGSIAGAFYLAVPLFKSAIHSLNMEKKATNDLVTSLGVVLMFITGHLVLLPLGTFIYFLGNKVQAKAKGYSKQKISNMFERFPRKVWLMKDGIEVEVPLDALHVGDVVIVRTGEVIPTDGTIIKGAALIDQQILTGEFQPAEKECEDSVLASTMVLNGTIYVKAEKTGSATLTAQLSQILLDSASHKNTVQLKGEEWADKGTLPILAASGMALGFGITTSIVVLQCSIGNKIRLYAPLGTLSYLIQASQEGILIKDGRALERLKDIDTVLFDKTGTLTSQKPKVGQVHCYNGYSRNKILRYAAAAECKLSHPIAIAITQAAKDQEIKLPDIEDSQYHIGYGVTVKINKRVVRVGSPRFMKNEGISFQSMERDIEVSNNSGNSLVMVAVDRNICGALEMEANLRPELERIISGLRNNGINHIGIVSGDQEQATKTLAENLGLDSFFYNVLPEQKAEIVERLQEQRLMW